MSDVGPELEAELEAVGVRWTFSSNGRGGARRWFLCPAPACEKRCAVLHLVGAELMCWACRKARMESRHRPAAPEFGRGTRQTEPTCSKPTAVAKRREQVSVAVREGRHPRELVENCKRVRVRSLLERFGPPGFDASTGAYICRVGPGHVFLLETSNPNYGGIRWWFLCPHCGGRSASLYSPQSDRRADLRCRRCWGLGYRSQLG